MGKIIYTIFEIVPLIQNIVPAKQAIAAKVLEGESALDYRCWMGEESRLDIKEPGNCYQIVT